MGVVFLAIHRSLQRECALKTISLKFKDPRGAERFIQEGQAVARLGKHPNIVQVFDAGIIDETPYIAMEYVEGESLDSRSLRSGPLQEPELIEIGRKLALALDHAHRRGLVHRDVKPANVVIDNQGEPQLLDFGIAKDLAASSLPHAPSTTSVPSVSEDLGNGSTASDATFITRIPSSPAIEGIQGTPAFMAPEQADPSRGPVDPRSDVYALGATLYVLATGRRPFEAGTITELLVRVVREPPPSPRTFADISEDLEAVLLMALEKEPSERYQTALEFADDLSRVTMGLPTRARKLGLLGLLGRRLRRHARLVAVVAASLILAAILATYFSFRSREIQVLWADIAKRTSAATAQEVRSLLDPALPMLEECVSLAESQLLPIDDQELLGRHLVARFKYRDKLSWFSYGDARGRFTGAWRDKSRRIVLQRSWLDEAGGHVREAFADGDAERLRWNDEWSYDPRNRPFYQLASQSKVPVWTKPYEWFAGEGLGITAALALREPVPEGQTPGPVRGVFTADYHLKALSDFLARLSLGSQGRAYLLGRDGSLLASPEAGAVAPDPLLSSAMTAASRQIPGGLDGLVIDDPRSFTFHHAKVPYVAAVQAFEPAAGLPVITFVLVPEDDIIGPIKASAQRSIRIALAVALIAIAVSVALGFLRKRRLVRSLQQRRRAAHVQIPPASDSSTEKTTILPASRNQ